MINHSMRIFVHVYICTTLHTYEVKAFWLVTLIFCRMKITFCTYLKLIDNTERFSGPLIVLQ